MFPSASMSVAALVRCACLRYPSCRCRSVTYPINLEDGGHEVLPCSTLRASMSAGVAMSCCRALFTPDQSRSTPFRRRRTIWIVHSGTDPSRAQRATRRGAHRSHQSGSRDELHRQHHCHYSKASELHPSLFIMCRQDYDRACKSTPRRLCSRSARAGHDAPPP